MNKAIITKLVLTSMFGVVSWLPMVSMAACGDGIIDPGEACDLGTKLNDGSHGCTSTCTVAPNPPNTTWTCTNTAADFATQGFALGVLFQTLTTRQTDPNLLKCTSGNPSTSSEITFCNQYKQDIIKFKDLNSIITIRSVQADPNFNTSKYPCTPNSPSTRSATTFKSFSSISPFSAETDYQLNCGQ